MQEFDPNGVGVANGNIFGFPYSESEAELVIIPVPWDATASYGKGTSKGPQAILDASTQLDFYHPEVPKAYNTKVYMAPISEEWLAINDHLCEQGKEYIDFLETQGEASARKQFGHVIDAINDAHEALRDNLKARSLDLLNQGKMVAVLGGEHSTPLGLLQALDETYDNFGILQIDAHADLRDAYEGFSQSHASIMHNAVNSLSHLSQLTQVGIRDVSEREIEWSTAHPKIKTFYDWELKNQQYNGRNWAQQVEQIINTLPQHVYISFDIDGLKPELCPHTGTPVAGGFELQEISYLIFEVLKSGRQLIGFDLNEVAPGPDSDWDANVGARALWQLVCAAGYSLRNRS
ncbi:MAG: hypothetical protein RLZZ301_246 [Bacteroidota bacterium]|jgi:agmatinase